MSFVLHAQGVVRRYGPRAVVDGVDLDLAAGEIVVLLGENGAGKTTLMRTLAGEIGLDAGSVEVLGIDLGREPERARRGLVYVSQRPPLAPLASLREHAEALAGFRGRDPAVWPGEMAELAAALRLGGSLDVPVRSLSGGMQHKAALVLGLLAQTPVAMFDEPHTGLDVRSALALRDLIRARRDSGTAFLLASHLAEATLALADRALVLRGGRVGRAFERHELAGFAGNARLFEENVLAAMGP